MYFIIELLFHCTTTIEADYNGDCGVAIKICDRSCYGCLVIMTLSELVRRNHEWLASLYVRVTNSVSMLSSKIVNSD